MKKKLKIEKTSQPKANFFGIFKLCYGNSETRHKVKKKFHPKNFYNQKLLIENIVGVRSQ